MVHRSHHATIKVCSKSFVKQLLWFVFKHGHMPLDAEGDWVSWAMCKGFTYCYTLWVQPVLFHINISQRDQAPALCALPRGPRISQKLTLIQSPGNGYVCMCVCVFVSLHHWCGHRAKVQSEMCGPGSGGAMASVNGEAKVSTSALTLSFFSRLLCH